MARLLIVSNRLPVTVVREDDTVVVRPSAGGLATGLRGPHERSGGSWIGWPGCTDLDEAERADVARRLDDLHAVPIWLSADEVEQFYEGFANGVLWPLFHYLLDQLPLQVLHWDAYERVNERFADAVAAHYRDGDLVWVHDYQLMLVPRLLRQRCPGARIGFFLHIPFPTSEVFRTLPYRERLLEGLLGADLVGFHTAAYARHFSSSLLRILGVDTDVDRVELEDHVVRLGVFPMGIEATRFAQVAQEDDVVAAAAALRGGGECTVFVGIDRLDYTKGIPRRLVAFETLLRNNPSLHGRVRLIQVAVPSRANVDAYRDFRQAVDALVGRVNGAFGTPGWTPVHYVYRALDERDLVALYRAADVMLVTPVRDGMNLVAKEFVATRVDEDGVLVLSEFAGAAVELAEALHVNPYDVDRAAEVYHRALAMPQAERRTRMRGLRRRVLDYDVHRWAATFIEALEEASVPEASRGLATTPPAIMRALVARMRAAPHLILLLDYDGTLVPFAGVPELASPDPALLDLLRLLAARPGTDVHVVSGRPWGTLDQWLGALPIGLHGEHGFWSRPAGGAWTSRPEPPGEWRARVHPILEQATARTPGSLIEDKTASIAWHYRMAEPEFGAMQANELRLHLTELLSNAPVGILTGEKVIELRPHDVHKGVVVPPLVAAARPGTVIVALGDDPTDEDLFAALPPDAIGIHVGPRPSRAPVRIAGVGGVRRLLTALLEDTRVWAASLPS